MHPHRHSWEEQVFPLILSVGKRNKSIFGTLGYLLILFFINRKRALCKVVVEIWSIFYMYYVHSQWTLWRAHGEAASIIFKRIFWREKKKNYFASIRNFQFRNLPNSQIWTGGVRVLPWQVQIHCKTAFRFPLRRED